MACCVMGALYQFEFLFCVPNGACFSFDLCGILECLKCSFFVVDFWLVCLSSIVLRRYLLYLHIYNHFLNTI